MHEELNLPLAMLLVFGTAKLLAEIAERLRMPGIVGEILAGVVVGPAALNWVAPNDTLKALADLGVLFLLFRVGLETKASDLLKVGGVATSVAISGVVLPLAAGWGIARLWGSPQMEAAFVGAAFVATSVGITAQVLSAKRVLQMPSSRIILAAAVIDDVLGLIVLAVMSGISRGHQFALLDVALTAVLPIVFTVVIAKWGTRGVSKMVPRMEARLRASEAQFNLSIVLLFALSLFAVYTGIAAIVGAFLAGMSLSENTSHRVHTLVHGTAELLVPFFLAGIGLHLDLSGFRDPSLAVLTVVVLLAAVLTKLVGCGLGAIRLGRKEALRVGIGMVPRGEVGMVVAQLGLSMGALSGNMYAVVVFASLATTIVAPPLMQMVYPEGGGEVIDQQLTS